MRRRIVPPMMLLLLLAPTLLPHDVQAAAPAQTPWWTTTRLDLDRDKVDDALEPLLQGEEPLRVLVAYADMPTRDQRDALVRAGHRIVDDFAHFPVLVVETRASDVPALTRLPGVVLVEKDDVVVPLLKESAPLIGAPQAWRTYGATGKGMVVAVLDDGAFEQHPDFEGKIVAHFDAGRPDGGTDEPIGLVAPAGSDGHGTHVAGTIVGPGSQSDGTYKGMAPDARFANVKVFTSANQTNSALVLDGLDWTLSVRERHGIRIASLSLGGRPSDGTDAISRGVNIAVDKGLVVVTAAGNAGPDAGTITSPGAAEKAITVGAVDKQKRLAPFSSRGPTLDGRLKPDLVAPGVAVTSTVPPTSSSGFNGFLGRRDTFYGPLSGTSMATPHVAGVVALMLEVNPHLAPIDVKRMLLVTAQDLGAPGRDNETGYGFVNGVAAVQVANDPGILEQPQFQRVLATIPDPPPEPWTQRLGYEAERLLRDRDRAVLTLAAVAVAVVLVSALVGRRGRGGSPPAAPPPP